MARPWIEQSERPWNTWSASSNLKVLNSGTDIYKSPLFIYYMKCIRHLADSKTNNFVQHFYEKLSSQEK